MHIGVPKEIKNNEFRVGLTDPWFLGLDLSARVGAGVEEREEPSFRERATIADWDTHLTPLFPEVRLPFGLHWPDGSDGLYPWIFNVADVCLVCGLIVLMILMYRHDRAEARAAKAAARAGR